MKHNNQKGFSIVMVLCTILVIAGLVLIGWYALGRSREAMPSDKSNQSNTQTDQKQNSKPSEGSAQSDSTEGGKYLVIKEWGVRITLPEALRGDVAYFINDKGDRDFGGPILVGFTSKKFSQGSLKCDYVDSLPRTLVSMYYEKSDHPNPENYEPEPFKVIEKRLYFLPETACQRAIDREGSPEDKQLLVNLKEAVRNTLEVNN